MSGDDNVAAKPAERLKQFTLGPLPLEIIDVLRIDTDCDKHEIWRCYQKIYGKNFKTVMLYGRCKLIYGILKSTEGLRIYEVDDGSGVIKVHFHHNSRKYVGMYRCVIKIFKRFH